MTPRPRRIHRHTRRHTRRHTHRHAHRRGLVAAAGVLACLMPVVGCTTDGPDPGRSAVAPLVACDLVDPAALVAATGLVLPPQGAPGAPVRDGVPFTSCTFEPRRTNADPTEGGIASFELSPAQVTAPQLDGLARATGNEVPGALDDAGRAALGARWLLGADLAQVRELYGEEAAPVALPGELAGRGAVAYSLDRHGVADVMAGGRLARVALVGGPATPGALDRVAVDVARRLEEERP